MSTKRHRAIATAVALLGLATAGLAGAGPAAAAPTCPQLVDPAQATFSNPTKIDNPWFPLTPGTRRVYEGTVVNDAGQPEFHRVTFTVTDLTKVFNGIKSVVVWDLDESPTGVEESELAFWAQDDAGNVWNTGEYPEEFPGGVFAGAPSTWLAGFDGAQAGVHMAATPVRSSAWYLQGYAETIEFEDCARVVNIGDPVTVPAGSFAESLTTEEKDAYDPASGIQTKTHVQGIGIVKIGAKNDPLNERLELVSHGRLDDAALAQVRQIALELDNRGYIYGDVYGRTERAQGPPVPPAPPAPPGRVANPEPPPVVEPREPVVVRVQRLSVSRARQAVRSALRQRLKDWRINRINCKTASRTRANCSFIATTRRGSRAGGFGVVTMRGAEGLVRYSLRARVVKGGCRPLSSRTCTRRSVWKSR